MAMPSWLRAGPADDPACIAERMGHLPAVWESSLQPSSGPGIASVVAMSTDRTGPMKALAECGISRSSTPSSPHSRRAQGPGARGGAWLWRRRPDHIRCSWRFPVTPTSASDGRRHGGGRFVPAQLEGSAGLRPASPRHGQTSEVAAYAGEAAMGILRSVARRYRRSRESGRGRWPSVLGVRLVQLRGMHQHGLATHLSLGVSVRHEVVEPARMAIDCHRRPPPAACRHHHGSSAAGPCDGRPLFRPTVVRTRASTFTRSVDPTLVRRKRATLRRPKRLSRLRCSQRPTLSLRLRRLVIMTRWAGRARSTQAEGHRSARFPDPRSRDEPIGVTATSSGLARFPADSPGMSPPGRLHQDQRP